MTSRRCTWTEERGLIWNTNGGGHAEMLSYEMGIGGTRPAFLVLSPLNNLF